MNHLFYWNGHKNLGDELSLYLVEKITNKKFIATRPPFTHPTLSAIGSLLTYKILSTNLVVWGTGTLTETHLLPTPLKIFPLSHLLKDLKRRFTSLQPDIRAVRGPKTKKLLNDIGIKCPSVYGDPAILMPSFYQPKLTEHKYQFGIIFHHTQYKRINTTTLNSLGIKFISIEREGNEEIESFIDEVCSCKAIFSSSLHGIVLAQAYGIPAQWIQVTDLPIQKNNTHKFHDYFLGADQIIQQPVRLTLTLPALNSLVHTTHPPKIRPFRNTRKLLDLFPFEILV